MSHLSIKKRQRLEQGQLIASLMDYTPDLQLPGPKPKPKTINDLPHEILYKVILIASDKQNFVTEHEQFLQELKKKKRRKSMQHRYGSLEVFTCKRVWQWQFVNKHFYAMFRSLKEKELDALPRPKISARIALHQLDDFNEWKRRHEYVEWKANEFGLDRKDPELSYAYPRILIYRYGIQGNKKSCVCIRSIDLKRALFPAKLTSHLTIQDLPIDKYLIDMLKEIDTSKIEEVHFFNVTKVEFENPEEDAATLLNLFPEAMEISFVGPASDEVHLEHLENVDLPEEMSVNHETFTGPGDYMCANYRHHYSEGTKRISVYRAKEKFVKKIAQLSGTQYKVPRGRGSAVFKSLAGALNQAAQDEQFNKEFDDQMHALEKSVGSKPLGEVLPLVHAALGEDVNLADDIDGANDGDFSANDNSLDNADVDYDLEGAEFDNDLNDVDADPELFDHDVDVDAEADELLDNADELDADLDDMGDVDPEW